MNIKEIRENLKLTQKDFANLIGKSVASLKNYESGKTEPGKDVMAKISEIANVSKEWLEGKAGDAAKAKAAPILTIEARMGGQITVDDILKRVPEGIDQVYIKPEENKAYWVKGEESGDITLW